MSMSQPPPRKRFQITIDLAAHDPSHAAVLLCQIARDIEIEIPTNLACGSGYSLRSTENADALPAGEYDDALIAWMRAERTGSDT